MQFLRRKLSPPKGKVFFLCAHNYVLKFIMGKSTWPGILIAFEGIDGCGKSTLARSLSEFLRDQQIPVVLTAEPSKGEIGQLIRKNLQKTEIPATIDALLFAADRLDHGYKELLPALRQAKIVITDRYSDSSYVYQSIQGKSENISPSWIRNINQYCLIPDLIFLLDLDAQISLNRRKQHNQDSNEALEKFENLQFQQEIRQKFLELAEEDKNANHIILDATQSTSNLLQKVIEALSPILKQKQFSLPLPMKNA